MIDDAEKVDEISLNNTQSTVMLSLQTVPFLTQ